LASKAALGQQLPSKLRLEQQGDWLLRARRGEVTTLNLQAEPVPLFIEPHDAASPYEVNNKFRRWAEERAMLPVAKTGDRVCVRYTGPLSDRSLRGGFGRRLLEFNVGSNEVLAGISRGVLGMAVGESKQLTLAPADAYGEVRHKRIREISRRRLPGRLEPYVGARLTLVSAASGRRRKVRIIELKAISVVIDGNHPLAGKVLEAEIMLISLNAPVDTQPGHGPDGETKRQPS